MDSPVISLDSFRRNGKDTTTPEATLFTVTDKTGAVHQIRADKMGSSPTALCFFKGEAMVFCLPLDLLYVAVVEDPQIVTSFRPEPTQKPTEEAANG